MVTISREELLQYSSLCEGGKQEIYTIIHAEILEGIPVKY
jgi:hypothetical protein